MKRKLIISIIIFISVIFISVSIVNGANLNIRATVPSVDVPRPPEPCQSACNQNCDSCQCSTGLVCMSDSVLGNICRNPLASSSPSCIVGQSIILNIHASPEKRKPFNNPDLTLSGKIQIMEVGKITPLVSFNFKSSPTGWMQAELPASIFPALPGNYDFYIKGNSYLNKTLSNIPIVNKTNKEVDGINQIDTDSFQTYYYRAFFPDELPCPFPGQPCINEDNSLLAGDVQFQKDNYVNGLDFGAMEGKIYETGEEEDLDYNGQVNGLDFSIAEFNIYKRGQ